MRIAPHCGPNFNYWFISFYFIITFLFVCLLVFQFFFYYVFPFIFLAQFVRLKPSWSLPYSMRKRAEAPHLRWWWWHCDRLGPRWRPTPVLERSVNESMSQSMNQWVNESVSEWVNEWVNESVNHLRWSEWRVSRVSGFDGRVFNWTERNGGGLLTEA